MQCLAHFPHPRGSTPLLKSGLQMSTIILTIAHMPIPYHTGPKTYIRVGYRLQMVTTCYNMLQASFWMFQEIRRELSRYRRLSDSIKDQDRTATTPVVGMVPDQPFPPWRHRPHVVVRIYKIYQDHPDPFRDESPILIPFCSYHFIVGSLGSMESIWALTSAVLPVPSSSSSCSSYREPTWAMLLGKTAKIDDQLVTIGF